jgi:hypothetical protein
LVASKRNVVRFDLVMPRIEPLSAFGQAAEATGWNVVWLDSVDRAAQVDDLLDLVHSRLPSRVVVVSGDPDLLGALPPVVDVWKHLDDIPDL